jgi:DNA invertase Pin-like site-specific DNA recombinase
MRAALYMRVSSDKQTTANQLPELQRYIDFHRWEAIEIYTDEDVSGKKTSRPAFDRMMQDAREKKFDVILVVRLDRLGRSAKHLLSILEELRGYGVGFASATQGIDTTTPAGKFLFTVLSGVAELEADFIRERTKAGLERVRKEGSKSGKSIGGQARINHQEVIRMRHKGQTQAQVAETLAISVDSVRRIEREAA